MVSTDHPYRGNQRIHKGMISAQWSHQLGMSSFGILDSEHAYAGDLELQEH